MVGDENGTELGQLLPWVFERGGQERPLVQRQREQFHIVDEGLLEPVCQVVAAEVTNEADELGDGVVGEGQRASSG